MPCYNFAPIVNFDPTSRVWGRHNICRPYPILCEIERLFLIDPRLKKKIKTNLKNTRVKTSVGMCIMLAHTMMANIHI